MCIFSLPSHCSLFCSLRIVNSPLDQLHGSLPVNSALLQVLLVLHIPWDVTVISIQILLNYRPVLLITESHLATEHMNELLDTFCVSLETVKSRGDSRKPKEGIHGD